MAGIIKGETFAILSERQIRGRRMRPLKCVAGALQNKKGRCMLRPYFLSLVL